MCVSQFSALTLFVTGAMLFLSLWCVLQVSRPASFGQLFWAVVSQLPILLQKSWDYKYAPLYPSSTTIFKYKRTMFAHSLYQFLLYILSIIDLSPFSQMMWLIHLGSWGRMTEKSLRPSWSSLGFRMRLSLRISLTIKKFHLWYFILLAFMIL